jgi:signal transduction histidine kinase/BarA-like signal transduction histidine kinase
VPAARILIVDDIAANRLAVQAVLQPLGAELIEARSGEEALKSSLTNDFAVVLMDVQMPGLDGFATVELLRQREKTRFTPVIFITAFGDISTSARGYSLGAFDFITKPFDGDILRARVGALVALWQRGQQLEQQATELRRHAEERARDRMAREAAEAASAMKDEFLAVVSHELRTPLNAILGWAEALRGGKLSSDRQQSALETISRNARLQARLIEDLLDVSRIIAGKLTITLAPVDLAAVARRAAETILPMAEEKGVGLEVVIEPGDHEIMGDAARLQQVAWNLISNAVKFSPQGTHVQLTLAAHDDELLLTVVDHGIGIAPEFLPHVFERFRQAEHGGTRQHGGLGLGLAIAARIVELHGGRISAYSDGLGQGAVFTVRMTPRARANQPPKVLRPTERTGAQTGQFRAIGWVRETPRLDGLRVLFVDDEADARELLAHVLGDAGAQVVVAASAAEALALLARERFDVMVSDIGMPGEDGYSLMRKVVAAAAAGRRMPPAIALSAFSSAQDRERALAAGFKTHLSKPLDAHALISFVERLGRD